MNIAYDVVCDVAYDMQVKTYDVVYDVQVKTYDVIYDVTYDIVRLIYDIVCTYDIVHCDVVRA